MFLQFSGVDFPMIKFSVLVLFSVSFMKLVSCECISPNVRTVLWRSSDLHRRCWSDRDIAVLYARRLFQLVLPMKVVSNVNHLLAHFKMCLKVVRDLATTKETHAMLMRPMADAIGGYLQAFGLPIAIEGYYEGNHTYRATKKADDLLKSIKKLLSTDGGRWTQPIHVQTSDQINPYEVVPANPFENHCIDLISSADLRQKCKNENELGWLKAKVPLPFFDDCQSPNAIAVPFRTKTLYSLFNKNSKDIFLRYYTAASHCYSVHGALEREMSPEQLEFDKLFHKWLIREVVPLLHDGVWYPAFGGVYRILALLSTRGLEFPWHHDRGMSGVQGRCLSKTTASRTPWFFVACILGFLAMFWLVVWVLLRLRRRRSLLRKTRCRKGQGEDFQCRDSQDWDTPGAMQWDKQDAANTDKQEAEKWNQEAGNWDNQEVEDWPDQDVSNWDSQDILDADAVISYSDECDTPHGDEMLEAIIESLLGKSSSTASNPSKNQPVDKPQPNYCLPDYLGENSLLSTSVLSEEYERAKLPHQDSYSIVGAAVVTQSFRSTPIQKETA